MRYISLNSHIFVSQSDFKLSVGKIKKSFTCTYTRVR
jgi:hypothetical protein